MKKICYYFMTVATVLLLGSTTVNAQNDYWENLFQKEPLTPSYYFNGGCSMGPNGATGIVNWQNYSQKYIIEELIGGCGDTSLNYDHLNFSDDSYTKNLVFNAKNMRVTNIDEKILSVELKPYEYKKEKEHYEKFVKWFEGLSLEEFYKAGYPKEYCENLESDDKDWCENGFPKLKEKFKTKPTWWEFYNQGFQESIDYISSSNYYSPEEKEKKIKELQNNMYLSEPNTWWKAYHFESEPTGVEVITHAKDLGKGSYTLSAEGKENITIDWTIQAVDFNKNGYGIGIKELVHPNAEGLAEILKDTEKYKNIIPEKSKHYHNEKEIEYNFSYQLSDKDDLSEMINNLKGKDLTVYFYKDQNGLSSDYLLNGKEIISTVNKGFTYDHNISMETSINKDKIDELVELQNAIYIDFAYHGSLPAPYKMNINIYNYIYGTFFDKMYEEEYTCGEYNVSWNGTGKEYEAWQSCENAFYEKLNDAVTAYLENTKFTLLYYNPETEKMEVIKENLKLDKADYDGQLEIELDHFSTYVIVGNDDYQITNNPKNKTNNAQTSNINVTAYSFLAIGSFIGISYYIIKKKNA